MSTHYVAVDVSDSKARVPEGDYSGRLYRPEAPPADFIKTFPFDIPEDVQVNDASFVVAFMIDPSSGADMPYQARLNGVEITSGHAIGGVRRGVWEIVQRNDLLVSLPQQNNIAFWALPNSDSRGFLKFSDVVVWFQSE